MTKINQASDLAAQSTNDSDLDARLARLLDNPAEAVRATIKVSNGLTIDEIIAAHHETKKGITTGGFIVDAYYNLFRVWEGDRTVYFDNTYQGQITSIEFSEEHDEIKQRAVQSVKGKTMLDKAEQTKRRIERVNKRLQMMIDDEEMAERAEIISHGKNLADVSYVIAAHPSHMKILGSAGEEIKIMSGSHRAYIGSMDIGLVTAIKFRPTTQNKASRRFKQFIFEEIKTGTCPDTITADRLDPNKVTGRMIGDELENEIPDEQKGLNPKTSEKGLRYNKGKLRLDLIPPEMLEGVADVLGYGAEKYADRNWEKGMSWMEVIASLKRHCLAFEKGEAIDGEGMTEEGRKLAGKSGLPHVDHIATNAAFLQTFFKRNIGADDRPIVKKS